MSGVKQLQMLEPMTLQQYMQYLAGRRIPVMMQGELTADAPLVRRMRRLIRSRGVTLWRMPDTRYVVEHFCTQIIGAAVRLRFPLHVRENAYMTDDGEIVVSQYFLYRSGGERILRVVLHELAHWWLSRQEQYPALLEMDREYLAGCGSKAESAVLSPVEFSATVLSSEMMMALARSVDEKERETLIGMARTELTKVNAAIRSLCL